MALMTMEEIAEIIGEEFPERSIEVSLSIWHHAHCSPSHKTKCKMTIYDVQLGEFLSCINLADGIAKLHEAINKNRSVGIAKLRETANKNDPMRLEV